MVDRMEEWECGGIRLDLGVARCALELLSKIVGGIQRFI